MLGRIFFYLIILVIVIGIAFYAYWRITKKTYTKERFAFVCATTSLSLISLMMPILFGNNDLLNVGINILNQITKWNIPLIQDLQLSARVLGIFIICIYLFFCYKIYINWSGQISIRQHAVEAEKTGSSFYQDLLSNFKNNDGLKIYEPVEELILFNVEFPKEENLPWHIKAANLLIISSNQFKINLSKDWHPQESCFISYYGDDKKNAIAILCSLDVPSLKKVNNFLSFADDVTKKSIYKYYLLVKSENIISESIKKSHDALIIKSQGDLLNELADFKDYKEYIISSFEKEEIIDGYNYTLSDIYTPPSCTLRKRKLNGQFEELIIEDIEGYIGAWLNNNQDKKQIALLGEYGQGKTVFAKRICNLIYKGIIKTDRIPIIVELRGKFPKQYSDLTSFLADWSSNFRLDPHALLRLHMSGRLLIIFDAFDEMELVGDYAVRLEHFRKIWNFNYPNSKIIITGRPNYFLNDNELKVILKTAENHTELPHCEELYINKFDKQRISSSLRCAEADTREDMLDILSNSNSNSSFIDLISRPALLFLTSIVWKERNLSQFKNNINSSRVIEEFLKQTYQRQNNKEIDTPLSVEERAYFMLGIAVKMSSSDGYTNQISNEQLKEVIDRLTDHFPEELTKLGSSKSSHNKISLKNRFDKRYSKETIFNDIRSCGIIVRDLSTLDNFRFAHKSFLEYLTSFFYASLLIDFKRNESERIMVRSIKETLNLNSNSIRKTSEVFKFISQIIAQRIEIKNDASEIDKMNQAFNIIHPYKKIGFKTADKLIPICGRDLTRAGLYFKSWILGLFMAAIMIIIMKGWLKASSRDFLFSNQTLTILVASFLSLFIIPIFIDNRMHKRNIKVNIGLEFDAIYNYIFRLLGGEKALEFTGVFSMVDTGNFNLWYHTCLELGVTKKTIKKQISHSLFSELDKNHMEQYNYSG